MNVNDDFQQSVDYIHDLVRFGWKPGLERFTVLCDMLGNPQDSLKCVHIAGTNGKGSVTAMISEILISSGYNIGSYYSPYVYDIRERVQYNNSYIDKPSFIRLTNKIKKVSEEIAKTDLDHPTEFEVKTALAFLYFAEKNVDFAVIEVGMGGRLDATNIIDPLVSVITNITMDHMDRLGNTIPDIAYEKAGIIKNCGHLVTASSNLDTLRVFMDTCRNRNSIMWHVRDVSKQSVEFEIAPVNVDDYQYELYKHDTKDRLPAGKFSVKSVRDIYNEIDVGMNGDFQMINAATAIAAVEVLQCHGYAIKKEAIYDGLKKAYLPGRFELISKNPQIIIDGAHNLDGSISLSRSIIGKADYNKLILIMGMLSGHSIEDVISVMAPLADVFIATASLNDRSVPAAEIAGIAEKYCENILLSESVEAAVNKAVSIAELNDLICITGSFYLIGEIPKSVYEINEQGDKL